MTTKRKAAAKGRPPRVAEHIPDTYENVIKALVKPTKLIKQAKTS